MKPLLLLICSVTFLLTSAQTYRSFPTGDASWKVGRCWYFYPGGWYDEVTFDMDGSDTLINAVTYKKVLMKHRHAPGTAFDSSYVRILGGMRESNRQIFFVSEELCGDTLERLIYDFNYENAGDTIYTNVLLFGYTDKVPHVISSIDSVLVGVAYHRRLHLTDTLGNPWESWIEGVGSNYGLGYATYWIMTDNSYDLVCFNSNGGLKYQNPAPTFAFCLPPYPMIDCDTGVLPGPGCTAEILFERMHDTVTFSGSSNHVTLNGFQWDFGDGQTATGQTEQHIYANIGWYEVCLTAIGTDSTGASCAVKICDSIYIHDGCIDSSLICLPPGGSLCCDAPIEEPVCGCDSVTYSNGCMATLWHGVMSYTDGPCETGIRNDAVFRSIRLVPNPAGARTRLVLETAEQGTLLVSVRNMLGETVLTHQASTPGRNAAVEMNVEKIPSGIYVVEMRLNGKQAVKKLVKE